MRGLLPLTAALSLLLGSLPGAPGADLTPFPRSTTHVVEMRNFAFSPARLEVAVGDTVVWVNRDAAPHTATDTTGGWDSGEVTTGSRWILVVEKPGRLRYVCVYHPSMRGLLVVARRQGRRFVHSVALGKNIAL